MTLDDEAVSWKAHERIERGVNPVLPEVSAAQRVGDLLGKHLPSYFSREFWTTVGGKAVASRDALRRMFDELDANPARLGDHGERLQQQRRQQYDDPDWWAEHVHHLRRELADAEAIYERVKAAHAPRQLVDRDERGQDEDARREQVERSIEDAPQVKGLAS